MVTLAAGCGAINGEHLSETGGQDPGSAGGNGGVGSMGGSGGQTGDASCVCPTIYAPVCGVNGVTYGASCNASCAGVAVAYQGVCVDGGASGACNSESDCYLVPSGCCQQTCSSKYSTALPASGCNMAIACPIAPVLACACVNHLCVNAIGGAGGTSGTAGSSGAADGGAAPQ
jgi:hypothetical protein